MANKNRILFLLKYLQQNSDEQHELTTAELRKALSDHGFPTSLPTLRDDVQTLIDSGFDISVNEGVGVTTSYSFVDRAWTTPELQILIDAVSSSQFLTIEKSKEMIKRLVDLNGPSEQDILYPSILLSEHVKAENSQIFLIVQAIKEGIEQNRKITFKYCNYGLDLNKHFRHDGEDYVISPYATVWKDDRYYLVGYSDKREKVVVFRIDRMDLVTLMEEERVPEPEDYNIQDYTDKIFKMYGGEEMDVTLRCKHELVDQVVDKFGLNIELKNITDETFEVTVPVSLSGTFFAWVFQYAGKMTIAKPAKANNWYVGMLQDALDDALGEQIEEGV